MLIFPHVCVYCVIDCAMMYDLLCVSVGFCVMFEKLVVCFVCDCRCSIRFVCVCVWDWGVQRACAFCLRMSVCCCMVWFVCGVCVCFMCLRGLRVM